MLHRHPITSILSHETELKICFARWIRHLATRCTGLAGCVRKMEKRMQLLSQQFKQEDAGGAFFYASCRPSQDTRTSLKGAHVSIPNKMCLPKKGRKPTRLARMWERSGWQCQPPVKAWRHLKMHELGFFSHVLLGFCQPLHHRAEPPGSVSIHLLTAVVSHKLIWGIPRFRVWAHTCLPLWLCDGAWVHCP